MKTKILSPLRRDGYKAGMIMMLIALSTMLLTTACSNEDDALNNTANTENTINKGYALSVTVNVTRQGDATTRTTYTDNGNGTGSLAFSAGDKLFVTGDHDKAGQFAGTLDYDAVSGKFSGTVTTKEEYTGTADALFTDANSARAFLMPAGYGSYGFFSIEGSGYNAMISFDFTKAFALTKAAAVEQFSVERAFSYSSGFALTPMNAIANFTISGLTANKEVAVSFDTGMTGVISGNVTTSAEGVATFVVGVGVFPGKDLKDYTLTVDGNNIAMPTKTTEAGKIYNISRSVPPAAEGHALSTSAVGEIVGTDGKAYAVGDKDNLPSGVTAVAMVAYKSATAGSSLAIALADEVAMEWSMAKSTCEGKAAIGGNSWKLPTQDEWKQMFSANGGDEDSYTGLNDALAAAGGYDSKLLESCGYWSSSSSNPGVTAYSMFIDEGFANWSEETVDFDCRVRACLAF